MSQPATPDVEVLDHGSVVMIAPRTAAAREWVEENVQLEGWQWMGGAFACEPRCVDGLVAGMEDAGLTVSSGL